MASNGRPMGPASTYPYDLRSASSSTAPMQRPTDTLIDMQLNTASEASVQSNQTTGKKRKNHRAGKKSRRNRRQSFLPSTQEEDFGSRGIDRPAEPPTSATAQPPFYRVTTSGGRNLSDTSLASDALLDHRLVWTDPASGTG